MSRLRADSETARRDIFLLKQVRLGKEAVKMADETRKTQMDLKDGDADDMEIIQKRKRANMADTQDDMAGDPHTTSMADQMNMADHLSQNMAKVRNNLMNNPRIITTETQINMADRLSEKAKEVRSNRTSYSRATMMDEETNMANDLQIHLTTDRSDMADHHKVPMTNIQSNMADFQQHSRSTPISMAD